MNGLLPFLPIFAALAVSAFTFKPRPGEPVNLGYVLKTHHLEHKDPRVAVFTHGTAHVKGTSGLEHKVSFLFMVPTLGSDLSGGFVCPGLTKPVPLLFLDPHFPGEHLVELLSFSDCKTWHAFLAHFWHPGLGDLTGKSAAFVKGPGGEWVKHALLPEVVSPLVFSTFFDFVRAQLPFELVPKVLDLLPSHPVAHALDGKVPHVERVHVSPVPEVPPVPSAPVKLTEAFLKGELVGADDRVAVVVPVSVPSPKGDGHLRFLHLVPTLGSDLSGGFATPGRLTPKVLPFTLPDFPGEHLLDLVGFSDCKKWYALHLTFWHPVVGTTHRAAGFERVPESETDEWKKHPLLPVGHPLGDSLAHFVKGHVPFDHLRVVLDHLPSHPVTHDLLKLSL